MIDKLPKGLIYVSDSTGGEKYNPISGRWDIGDLNLRDSVSLIITTRVDIKNSTIVNIAVVNSTTPDNNTDNNKANNTTHVDDFSADLEVIKLVSASSAKSLNISLTNIIFKHNKITVKIHCTIREISACKFPYLFSEFINFII